MRKYTDEQLREACKPKFCKFEKLDINTKEELELYFKALADQGFVVVNGRDGILCKSV